MTQTKSEIERIYEAYIEMATEARYRPAAPGDGVGNINLSDSELADRGRLQREALEYAQRFIAEEDTLSFYIGVSIWETNRALVYLVEASRVLCGGMDDGRATKLVEMALEELRSGRTAAVVG